MISPGETLGQVPSKVLVTQILAPCRRVYPSGYHLGLTVNLSEIVLLCGDIAVDFPLF
jgi:hypothetical protein